MTAKQVRVGGLTRSERARRFWTAHGRSPAHVLVLHAFANNPTLTWTADGLSTWYGVPIPRVRLILRELAAAGIVVGERRPWRGFRWNPRHNWAVPTTSSIKSVVRDRWVSLTQPGRARASAG